MAYNKKQEHPFENKKFLEVVDNSILKKGGHQVMHLSFHKDNICLPNNWKIGEKRLMSHQTDGAFQNGYISFMTHSSLRPPQNSSQLAKGDKLSELYS